MAMHAPDAVAAPPLATAPAVPLSLADRLLKLRDRLYASRAFHRFASTYAPWRWITRVRSRQVFDLVGGFVYTQVITTCFAVDLFRLLDGGPQDEATIARHTGLGDEGTRRLLRAAASLRLVSTRSRGRWGLGPLGGPLVHDRALARMVAHNQHFYRDLADPSAILRKARGETELSRFWSYGAAERPHEIDPLTAAEFSGIMADTIPPLARGSSSPRRPGGTRRCACSSSTSRRWWRAPRRGSSAKAWPTARRSMAATSTATRCRRAPT